MKPPAVQLSLTNNIVSANGGYGLLCLTEGPLSSHNDLWLNAAGDYLALETPLISKLPQEVWRTLMTHLAKRTDDGRDTPYIIDGNYLLADPPAR